jgi:NADH-quinone oxidoreductase subunit C
MTAAESAQALKSKFTDGVTSVVEFRGETTIHTTKAVAYALIKYCRDELAYDLMLDISSVDHMGQDPRFEMVYEIYSISGKSHLRIKFPLSEDDTEAPTVSDIYPTANWHEREVYDMMGITFSNHPDLRRILMWDGYPYFPLRKEFPLAGKSTDVPDVAFTGIAPLAGGPFVTAAGAEGSIDREPRARD